MCPNDERRNEPDTAPANGQNRHGLAGLGDDLHGAACELLNEAGWAEATLAPLAGDASTRQYWRLSRPSERTSSLDTAILAISPDPVRDIVRFADIAEWLNGQDVTAPRILARNDTAGILLQQDLGDQTLAEALDRGLAPDLPYRLATQQLTRIARLGQWPLALAANRYDADTLTRQAELALDMLAFPDGARAPEGRKAFREAMTSMLIPALAIGPRGPLLRDFHAGNIIWRPRQAGLDRIALIDIQDAGLGPCIYDLVSLIEDARRSPPDDLAVDLKHDYGKAMDLPNEAMDIVFPALAVQRHMRVLGVFARLASSGHRRYWDSHAPRVVGYLTRHLTAPGASPVKQWIATHAPRGLDAVIADTVTPG